MSPDRRNTAASRRSVLRLLAAPILALCLTGLLGPAAASATPSISSFYVRDEGANVRLRVNFCDARADLTDSYSATFRVWDENGLVSTLVIKRRVSGRVYDYCGRASLALPDTFANGVYSANVAVTNRTTGDFSRIGIRYFQVR